MFIKQNERPVVLFLSGLHPRLTLKRAKIVVDKWSETHVSNFYFQAVLQAPSSDFVSRFLTQPITHKIFVLVATRSDQWWLALEKVFNLANLSDRAMKDIFLFDVDSVLDLHLNPPNQAGSHQDNEPKNAILNSLTAIPYPVPRSPNKRVAEEAEPDTSPEMPPLSSEDTPRTNQGEPLKEGLNADLEASLRVIADTYGTMKNEQWRQ